MQNLPGDVPASLDNVPLLVSQAASVLMREAARLPTAMSALGAAPGASSPRSVASYAPANVTGQVCPVTGAAAPSAAAASGKYDKDQLRTQAHELLAGVLGMLGAPAPTYTGSGARSLGELESLAGVRCPITKAELPVAAFDKDQLRRQAHAFIETLLITFNDATGERGLPSESQVPLVQCVAPVQPGGTGRASLHVTNEEGSPSEVTLYTSSFVADSGYEIPALRVSVTPRRVTIPAGGGATFEIALQISQQTPAGTYSGLIQAMGNRYVKAVLSVDVL
jgi:hypothetical protein